MAIMNQWGDGLDEEMGDIIYDTLEHKAKEEAKDLAKDVVQASGKAAVNALDKATDHIAPVKQVKDKIKEKLSNNPITRLKAAVKRLKEKAKQAVKKAAAEGVKAVGHAAMKGLKALGKLAAKNPVVTFIVVIILLAVMSDPEAYDPETETDADGDTGTETVLIPTHPDSNIFPDRLTGLGNSGSETMTDDDIVVILMGDCAEHQFDSMGSLDTDKEESAKFIYSVFRSSGFNNVSIAGILANIDKESGLDPSAIEGIFSEYGYLGSKKAEALLSMSNYTENILFPKYQANGTSINRDGYKTTDADGDTVYYCGMGLVQWTGGNALTLMTAANTLGYQWYNMDFQLAYMLSDSMYRSGFFAGWLADQEPDYSFDINDYDINDYATQEEYDRAVEQGKQDAMDDAIESARQSAIRFAHDYEGNTATDTARADIAEDWYEIIKDWGDGEVNTAYSESIAGLATELGGIIEFLDIQETQYRCGNGNVFDNSSLAGAAVSMAWPTRDQSFNNGTNLYQVVKDAIFPSDYIYKSCDRTVATAVRWSGTDDDYPKGNTADQLAYLVTSSKWELVGSASSLTIDDLLPGDVFILNGHTFVYVSSEIIQSAYANEADPSSDSVSGSLNERSPACDTSSSSIINRGGDDWEGRGVYDVYRCVNPDRSTTYSHVGSSMTN